MSTWFALYPYVGGGRGTYPRVVEAVRRVAYCHLPQLPGRDGRYGEPPLARFDDLADDLWTQLREPISWGHCPDDLILFGFSMGGLLATELAARAQATGRPPRGLVVGGCPPPGRLDGSLDLSGLSDDDFVASLDRLGMMSPSLREDPEFVAVMLPIWRADCAAVATHPDRAVELDCEVIAFAGKDDPLVPAAVLSAWMLAAGPGSTTLQLSGGHRLDLEVERLASDLLVDMAKRSMSRVER